jgi:hypothetical protein
MSPFCVNHVEDCNAYTFGEYLIEIERESTWLQRLEVRAPSDFLHYPIKVTA